MKRRDPSGIVHAITTCRGNGWVAECELDLYLMVTGWNWWYARDAQLPPAESDNTPVTCLSCLVKGTYDA